MHAEVELKQPPCYSFPAISAKTNNAMFRVALMTVNVVAHKNIRELWSHFNQHGGRQAKTRQPL